MNETATENKNDANERRAVACTASDLLMSHATAYLWKHHPALAAAYDANPDLPPAMLPPDAYLRELNLLIIEMRARADADGYDPIDLAYHGDLRCLEIGGLMYAYDLFANFGRVAIGTLVRIVARDGGKLTLETVREAPLADAEKRALLDEVNAARNQSGDLQEKLDEMQEELVKMRVRAEAAEEQLIWDANSAEAEGVGD